MKAALRMVFLLALRRHVDATARFNTEAFRR